MPENSQAEHLQVVLYCLVQVANNFVAVAVVVVIQQLAELVAVMALLVYQLVVAARFV